MAGASISVYEFDTKVRGQHVYKSVWTPLTDKVHKYIMREDGNKHDEYTVIHSAALSRVATFEPLCVYEPGFNPDKYGTQCIVFEMMALIVNSPFFLMEIIYMHTYIVIIYITYTYLEIKLYAKNRL